MTRLMICINSYESWRVVFICVSVQKGVRYCHHHIESDSFAFLHLMVMNPITFSPTPGYYICVAPLNPINMSTLSCRWYSAFSVQMKGEASRREQAKELVGDDLASSEVPLTFPSEANRTGHVIKLAPCVHLKNIAERIRTHLDHLERYSGQSHPQKTMTMRMTITQSYLTNMRHNIESFNSRPPVRWLHIQNI